MLNVGTIIKDYLLEDSTITDIFGTNIYNLVVYTTEEQINPPYLVIDVNSVTPSHTKDLRPVYDIEFSIHILVSKYSDLQIYSELVYNYLKLKTIETDSEEVGLFMLSNYDESFDGGFELYNGNLTFIAKGINK